MVEDYPVDGSFYLIGILLQGAKWDYSYSDAPGFLAEMVNKALDPKIPVMYVFAIKLKNKYTVRYYEFPVYHIISYFN